MPGIVIPLTIVLSLRIVLATLFFVIDCLFRSVCLSVVFPYYAENFPFKIPEEFCENFKKNWVESVVCLW